MAQINGISTLTERKPPNTGPITIYQENSGIVRSWFDTRSTKVNRNFDQYGWRLPNAYWRYVHKHEYPKGTWYGVATGTSRRLGGPTIHGFLSHSLPGLPAHDPKALAQAESKAILKAKNQKINLAQAFAERAQTARLVSNSAMSIVKALVAVRRGNPKAALAALGLRKGSKNHNWTTGTQAAADRWLEIQYGWKPLLSDVHGAVSSLEEKDGGVLNRYVVTVRGRGEVLSNSNLVLANTSGRPYQRVIENRSTCRVRLDLQPNNTYYKTLGALGVTNPVTIAWELLPWSFVADWFVPVGDFIQQFDASLGWRFLSGTKSQRMFSTYRDRGLTYGSKNGWAPLVQNWRAAGFYLRIDRVLYTAFPSPNVPSFKNPFSALHVANALALLRGSFKVR